MRIGFSINWRENYANWPRVRGVEFDFEICARALFEKDPRRPGTRRSADGANAKGLVTGDACGDDLENYRSGFFRSECDQSGGARARLGTAKPKVGNASAASATGHASAGALPLAGSLAAFCFALFVATG